jgi:predicted GH43/DUF377 family glycosyl hydrolase
MHDDLAVRIGPRIEADPRRVITKLFVPGEETPHGRSRASAVVARILALDEAEVASLAAGIVADYGPRHGDLAETLAENFAFIAREIAPSDELSQDRRTLIGAYFTHEFSTEGAALCNPSMVAHPDQSNLQAGQLRFIMTVRCIGEGHISSIGFRTGIVGPAGALVVDEPARHLVTGVNTAGRYERALFLGRLADLGNHRDDGALLLGELPESFDQTQLNDALTQVHEHTLNRERMRQAIDHVYQTAASSYEVTFPADIPLSGRVLWPAAPAESNGMEDARLVEVVEDGRTVYHATYTAYDGSRIATHRLSTTDFVRFTISPLAGRGARNKGLALFPRRVKGRCLAVSRWDRENLALVASDDGLVWDEPTPLYEPQQGWELTQVGNGGSPIETPYGWLLITHGSGAMRGYSLGAILLDLADPTIVRATLPGPLLTPSPDERDGYVPNVVYTCGVLLHAGVLTIPYGISDGAIGFAQIGLSTLIERMTEHPQ